MKRELARNRKEEQRTPGGESTGNAVIVTFGNYPLLTKYTPSYQCPQYQTGRMSTDELPAHAFRAESVYYDVDARNDLVLGAGVPQVMLDGHTVALSPSETARYIAALNDALARGLALTEAQQSRNVTENTYLLRVQTGVNPGACVYYFGVGYLDDRGVERTEYIFPEDGVLERSYPNGSEMDDENSGKLYLSGAYPSRTIEFGESSRSVIGEHNAICCRCTPIMRSSSTSARAS